MTGAGRGERTACLANPKGEIGFLGGVGRGTAPSSRVAYMSSGKVGALSRAMANFLFLLFACSAESGTIAALEAPLFRPEAPGADALFSPPVREGAGGRGLSGRRLMGWSELKTRTAGALTPYAIEKDGGPAVAVRRPFGALNYCTCFSMSVPTSPSATSRRAMTAGLSFASIFGA